MTPAVFDALTQLAVMLQGWVLAGFVVLARVGAVFALLPGFGERVVPVRVKLILALAMTGLIAPAVLPAFPAPAAPGPMLLLRETAVGLALGAGLRLLVLALQVAGTIAAQATSLAQFFGGAGVDPQPAMSQVLVMGGLALLMVSGFPLLVAEFLVLTYVLLPPDAWPDSAAMAHWGLAQVARGFGLAFVLAAPFVIGGALYNLALGAINRAMPQLMVAFIGAPALTLGGLAMLLLAAPVMLSAWQGAVMGWLADPLSVRP